METLESAQAAAHERVIVTQNQIQVAPNIVDLAWARTAHMAARNRAQALAEMSERRFRLEQAREAVVSFDLRSAAVAGALATMAYFATAASQHTNA